MTQRSQRRWWPIGAITVLLGLLVLAVFAAAPRAIVATSEPPWDRMEQVIHTFPTSDGRYVLDEPFRRDSPCGLSLSCQPPVLTVRVTSVERTLSCEALTGLIETWSAQGFVLSDGPESVVGGGCGFVGSMQGFPVAIFLGERGTFDISIGPPP